jgi:Zn-dependent M28 family amino/carboxypeptidase
MRPVRHGLVRWLFVLLTALLALGGARAGALDDSVQVRLRRDVTFLASDPCEGRGVATPGINLAAAYIAAEFKKAGLKPGGAGGSYYQPFTMPGGVLEAPPDLALAGPLGQRVELKAGQDYEPMGLSYSGEVKNAPLAFVGYGATVASKEISYDDYAGLDATGKVVVILRETPRTGNAAAPFPGGRRPSSLVEKLQNAERHHAAAVLFVSDAADAADGDDLMTFSYSATVTGSAKLPAFHVRRATVDALLQGSLGTTLAEREQDIDRDLRPHSADLPGWAASLSLQVGRSIRTKNVVGHLDGAGPLAQETVVVGAHYDHLGYGGPGSLAGVKKPAIHHGADDNGSGATALMELARQFARLPNRQGRRLVFVAFSGEEMGLYGSVHYCKEPLFPLDDTVAMVNLDMVGRLRPDKESKKDRLIIEGTGTAKGFNDLLDRVNAKYDFQLKRVPSGFGPSDHSSFYAKQIPVLFFFTDDHPDYHRPSDTAEKINVAGMERVLDMAADVITDLAAAQERPRYVKLATSSNAAPGDFPKVGIRPSYGDDKEGVLLDGVSDGGPAARAGLKAGDRIVDLGGRTIKNLEAYMTLIRAHKKGEPIEFGVLRDGKKITIKVTPE